MIQLHSILFCVQFKSLINSPAKQKFAAVSPRVFFELVFHSSNNFALYDEVFLKFSYSDGPLALVS
jgi:hypothetical protein